MRIGHTFIVGMLMLVMFHYLLPGFLFREICFGASECGSENE